jgi:plastocyanin
MRTISAIRIATALAVMLLGAPRVVAAQPAPAAAAEVEIDQYAFLPQRVTVKAGTTVTWTNDDDDSHTVASSSKLFKSKALDTRDKFSFTFTTPGTYDYFCSLHPYMKGAVVVESASASNAAE